MLKKTLIFITNVLLLLGITGFCMGLDSLGGGLLKSDSSFPYNSDDMNFTKSDSTDSEKLLQGSDNLIQEQMESFGLSEYTETQGAGLVFVKKVINFLLALLGVIATMIIIYGFYLIVIPGGKSDEQLKNAKKYIKISVVAIVMIGLSRLIVQFIFNIYSVTQ
ncbi:MAG: hypothetical protein V3575_03160 [Candidatus Absconditabacteria bacterium]